MNGKSPRPGNASFPLLTDSPPRQGGNHGNNLRRPDRRGGESGAVDRLSPGEAQGGPDRGLRAVLGGVRGDLTLGGGRPAAGRLGDGGQAGQVVARALSGAGAVTR